MDWEERIGRRLTLWDLSILLTAVEAGSMSKAAEQLRVSQPAISKTIALLEREVGAKLVRRSSRGIEPTSHGHALLARSRAALGELRHAIEDMDVLSDPKAGTLRLAANEVALSGAVGTVINRLNSRYPGIVFEIIPAYTHADQIRQLELGNVELVVGQMEQSDLERHLEGSELFQDELVVAAGTNNPWAHRRKIDLAELMDEAWAFAPLTSISGRSMEHAFQVNGLGLPRIMVVASSMQLLRSLVIENEFLALFPSSVVKSAQDVRVLPVNIGARWQPIGILTVKHRMLSPLAKLFMECAHQVMRDIK